MDAFVGTSSGVLKGFFRVLFPNQSLIYIFSGLTLSKSSFVNLRAARQPTIPPDPSEQNEDEQGGQVGEQQQIAATAVDRKSQAITAISFTDTDQARTFEFWLEIKNTRCKNIVSFFFVFLIDDDEEKMINFDQKNCKNKIVRNIGSYKNPFAHKPTVGEFTKKKTIFCWKGA